MYIKLDYRKIADVTAIWRLEPERHLGSKPNPGPRFNIPERRL